MDPPRDAKGAPIHSWDKCSHPRESLFLDCEKGWLVCTACALILKENAIQMLSDGDGKPRQTISIRGADSEYNEWRSGELDIVDAMSRLGIVDNDAAYAAGRANSIWAGRDRALMWLDMRRRILASAAHRHQICVLNQMVLADQPSSVEIPQYSRDTPSPMLLSRIRQERSDASSIKFLGGLPGVVQALEAEADEIDFEPLREARRVRPPAAVLRRRNCVRAWERLLAAFRSDLRRRDRWAAFDLLQGRVMQDNDEDRHRAAAGPQPSVVSSTAEAAGRWAVPGREAGPERRQDSDSFDSEQEEEREEEEEEEEETSDVELEVELELE